MKTTLYRYCVARYSPEAKEIDKLREATQGEAGRPMICIGKTDYADKFPLTSELVELDVTHLFSNQWNEKGGLNRRLFDYYEESKFNRLFKNVRYGHWLVITEEMAALRDNTLLCGYCGAHYGPLHVAAPSDGFCNKCLGSEYLEAKQLHLLKLRPISCDPCAFSEEEEHGIREQLRGRWEVAQGLGKLAREELAAAKLRRKVAALIPDAKDRAAQLISNAQTEAEAFTWLLDHKYRDIDNVIFYNHKSVFCFGWRRLLSPEEKSELETLLCEFPFDYELKTR